MYYKGWDWFIEAVFQISYLIIFIFCNDAKKNFPSVFQLRSLCLCLTVDLLFFYSLFFLNVVYRSLVLQVRRGICGMVKLGRKICSLIPASEILFCLLAAFLSNVSTLL